MALTAILDANVAEMADLAINYPEMGCVDFNMLLNVLHILIYKLQLIEKPVEVHSDEALVPPLQPASTIKVSEHYAEKAGRETENTVIVVKRDSRPSPGEPMSVRKEPADTIERRREVEETLSPGFNSKRLDGIDEEIIKIKEAIGKLAFESGVFRESLTALIKTDPKKGDQHQDTSSEYGDDKGTQDSSYDRSHHDQKAGTDARSDKSRIQDKAYSEATTDRKVSSGDRDEEHIKKYDSKSSGRHEDGQVPRNSSGSQTLYEDSQVVGDRKQSQVQHRDTQVDQDKAHSQAGQDRAHSQESQDRTHSQGGQDKAHSQGGQDRAHSQGGQDRAHSQGGQDRAHSQGGQDRAHSQGGQDRAQSQASQDRAHSQLEHGESQASQGRRRPEGSQAGYDRAQSQTHRGTDGGQVGRRTEGQTGELSQRNSLKVEKEAENLTENDLAPLQLWKKIRLLELKVQKCCDKIALHGGSQEYSGATDGTSRQSAQGERSHLFLERQMSMLQTVHEKLDELARNMADKADMRHLARKVSNEQFEFVCDDIARTIKDALDKLDAQEDLWQQALDDVQRDIETKLDKVELAPIKDFFNDKFKTLQNNLKNLASLRREATAAGATKGLMSGLNCIACDADTSMKTKADPAIPLSKPVHAQMSIKPYLTYELDAVRKERANVSKNRNMKDWEILDKQMRQPVQVRSATDRHLCSRYCGGSHTVTTPYQRVARLGHFLRQWGPDCFPLGNAMAAGDVKDNHKPKGGKINQEKRPHSPGGADRKKLKKECSCTGS